MKNARSLVIAVLFSVLNAVSPAWAFETGANDFRITNVGPDGDTSYFASRQQIAYNSVDNEYLVVFLSASDDVRVATGEIEIWGQRVSASGQRIGSPTILTDIGGLGVNTGENPGRRHIIHNPVANQYFLVYDASDSRFPSSGNRIFGRLIGSDGEPDGATFTLSTPPVDGTGDFAPSVAYNSVDDNYLLVWTRAYPSFSNQTVASVISTDGTGGTGPFRVDTVDGFKFETAVAYNPNDNQHLVMWRNNIEPARIQIVDATGNRLLAQDVDLGTAGYFSSGLEAAYNPDADEFLVVFGHSDTAFNIMNESYDFFGRRVSTAGVPLGAGKFRISYSARVDKASCVGANIDVPPSGLCLSVARPGLSYSAADQAFAVSWGAGVAQFGTNQREAFVRLLPSGQDAASIPNQYQVSNAGGEEIGFAAQFATVAANSNGGYLVVWWGADNRNGGTAGEAEIWGQLLNSDILFVDQI